MTEFENALILQDQPYQTGFFPKIPNFRKEGSAFILTGGANDDLLVTDRTTTKELRQGKYTRLVEISTRPYLQEVNFSSPSKEAAYSFAVYIKAVIQVQRPITFYVNKNLDISAYFENLFSMDVRKITRKYSILDYEGMDEELTEKLSAYNNFDESTGFSYRISIVLAEPDENAEVYVKKNSTQQLDMQLKKNARDLTSALSANLPEALKVAVVEGRMTEEEALKKIGEYKDEQFQAELKRMKALRDSDILTDTEAKAFARGRIASAMGTNLLEEQASGDTAPTDEEEIDEMYKEDE
ncbi:hypothetical protein [Acutalibacter muris]|uniref:hypothetical protein n=1 Tax=Acutalibacter muris TaxID=1796620 RepID=UPI00272A6CBB|nr:hypothetical protein [Acutalibacter muris]